MIKLSYVTIVSTQVNSPSLSLGREMHVLWSAYSPETKRIKPLID